MKQLIHHNLYSGGAFGADTFFGLIALEYGITSDRQWHYNINNETTQDLQNKGIYSVFLNQKDIDDCYHAIDKLFQKKHKRGHVNDLKARNYFQALDADGIFGIASLNKTFDGVQSGTNVAIQFGIHKQKPVYVYDYTIKKWYKYSDTNKQFLLYDSIPLLTQHFAGIGVRKCQNYEGCRDYLGKDIENDIKQQIRCLFENVMKFKN